MACLTCSCCLSQRTYITVYRLHHLTRNKTGNIHRGVDISPVSDASSGSFAAFTKLQPTNFDGWFSGLGWTTKLITQQTSPSTSEKDFWKHFLIIIHEWLVPRQHFHQHLPRCLRHRRHPAEFSPSSLWARPQLSPERDANRQTAFQNLSKHLVFFI